MKLDFYKLPLRDKIGCGYIYDAQDNFMFQFEDNIPPHIIGGIMRFINRENKSDKSNFRKHPDNPIVIQCLSDQRVWVDCITIRGWGNLTGVGANNFSEDRAIEIQNNLVKWLLYKLNKQK